MLLESTWNFTITGDGISRPIIKYLLKYTLSRNGKPVDMWTRPSDQPVPRGTRAQSMDNTNRVDHSLHTPTGLAPTYPQPQQEGFILF